MRGEGVKVRGGGGGCKNGSSDAIDETRSSLGETERWRERILEPQ